MSLCIYICRNGIKQKTIIMSKLINSVFIALLLAFVVAGCSQAPATAIQIPTLAVLASTTPVPLEMVSGVPTPTVVNTLLPTITPTEKLSPIPTDTPLPSPTSIPTTAVLIPQDRSGRVVLTQVAGDGPQPTFMSDRPEVSVPSTLPDLTPRIGSPTAAERLYGSAAVDQVFNSSIATDDRTRFVQFVADGTLLIPQNLSPDIWDLTQGRVVGQLTNCGAIYGEAVSPNGQYLVGSTGEYLCVWDLATGTLVNKAKGGTGNFVAYRPTENSVIVFNDYNQSYSIQFYSVPDLTLQASLLVPDLMDALAFSPDGHLLAAAGRDFVVYVWDMNQLGEPTLLRGHTKYVTQVAFAANAVLVSGSGDGTIKVWDLTTNTPLASFNSNVSNVDALALSPDHTLLTFANGFTRDVPVMNLRTGMIVGVLNGFGSGYASLAFSQDGSLLAGGQHVTDIWSIPRFWYTQPDSAADPTWQRVASLMDSAAGANVDFMAQQAGVTRSIISVDSNRCTFSEGTNTAPLNIWYEGPGSLTLRNTSNEILSPSYVIPSGSQILYIWNQSVAPLAQYTLEINDLGEPVATAKLDDTLGYPELHITCQ